MDCEFNHIERFLWMRCAKTLGCQGFWKTQADPFGLSRLFKTAGTQGIGAGHHKKSLNLGLKKIVTGKDCFSEDRGLNGKEAQGSNVWNPGVVSF